MPAHWEILKADAIKQFIRAVDIDIDCQLPIAQIIDRLEECDFTVTEYLLWQSRRAGVVPPPMSHPPKPKLAAQMESEDISDFLQRANALFTQSRVSANDKLGFLLQAVLPQIKTHITAMYDAGVTDYAAVCAQLREIFCKSFIELLTEFRSCRRNPGESFKLYGYRLKSLYQKLLKVTTQVMETSADLMLVPLLEQLLHHESTQLRGHVFIFFEENRAITFDELCGKADVYVQAHSSVVSKPLQSSFKPPVAPRATNRFCAIHNSKGHWTSECTQNRTNRSHSTTSPQRGEYHPPSRLQRPHQPAVLPPMVGAITDPVESSQENGN